MSGTNNILYIIFNSFLITLRGENVYISWCDSYIVFHIQAANHSETPRAAAGTAPSLGMEGQKFDSTHGLVNIFDTTF